MRRLALAYRFSSKLRNYSIFGKSRVPSGYDDNQPKDAVHPLLKELSLILGPVEAPAEENKSSLITENEDPIQRVHRNFDLQYKPRAVQKIVDIVKSADSYSIEERLQGFQIENDVAEKVLQRLIDVPYSAFRFFDWANRNGLRDSKSTIFKTLIYIAGEAGEMELLERVGDELGDNEENWKLLILQLGKMKVPEKAVELFEKMRKRGCDGDQEAYRMMIRLLSENGNDEVAFRFFMEMTHKKMVPDLDSSILLIRCLAFSGDIRSLLLASIKTMSLHKIPESRVYGAVLSCLSQAGRLGELIEYLVDSKRVCFRVFEELKNPPVEACNVVVKEYGAGASDSDAEEVRRILSSSREWFEIEEQLKKLGFHFTSDLVLEVMRENMRRGRVALSFFFWVAERRRFKHTSETYNMALKIAGSGKDFVTMRKLFHEMRRKECVISADTWGIMIMRYGRTGMTEIALKVFAEMKRKGYTPSYGVYKCLITCLCDKKGRKINRAIRLFRFMIRAGHRPEKKLIDSYLVALCESGKILSAKICIRYLREIGYNKTACESWYIRALCRAGRVEEALESVDDYGEGETKIDLEKNTMASLVHGLLRRGEVGEALERIEMMREKGIRAPAQVYTSLMGHFMKMKDEKRAREIWGKMKREECDGSVVTCYTMIRGYMGMGRNGDAWKVLDEMEGMGLKLNFELYSMMIERLCKSGGSEEAFRLLLRMDRDGIVPSCVHFRNVYFALNMEGKAHLARPLLAVKSTLKRDRRFFT